MTDKGTEVLNQKIQFGFNPGDKFGSRYQIIEEIGHGGMGKVFKAKDLELNEVVALKMIKPELSTDESIIARFKRELQLARELNHDNVIRIHDLGEIDGVKYISMKYIEGITLSDLIKTSGKLSVEKTTEVTVQILSALDAAHKKGVIHRDLKPQNIMIDKKGMVILLDFGIARSIDSANVTGTGVVLGTPDFISPEQIEGRKSSPQTDIYSFGIILYEMLTGKLPFKADSSLALMHKHLNEKPAPPSSIEPSIPKYYEDIIMKCLEKKSEDRYSDVAQIKELLIKTDIKTNKLKSIKVKKPKKIKNFKYLKYAGYGLLAVYLIISIISLVVDNIYENKFEKLEVEYDTYYKNLFPIQKTWLPKEWILENNNAWNYYTKLFGTNYKNSFTRDLKYKYKISFISRGNKANIGIEKIKNFLNIDLKHIKKKFLLKGIKCKKITSPHLKKEGYSTLNWHGIRVFNEYLAVSARLDFIDGNYNKGLKKILYNQYANVDILLASRDTMVKNSVLSCLSINSKELIPLLLSNNLDVKSEYIQRLENIYNIALKKINLSKILYAEFLYLIKDKDSELYNFSKLKYHLFGKISYFQNWFSYSSEYYMSIVPHFRKMLKDIKYIRNIRDKSIYIKDYFQNNFQDINIYIRYSPLRINIERTFLKLVLNLICIRKYGLDSIEYLKLHSSEIGINDLSGRKFEFIDINGEKHIKIMPDFNLSLKLGNYKNIYKKTLKNIYKYLDKYIYYKDLKNIFYDYDMD